MEDDTFTIRFTRSRLGSREKTRIAIILACMASASVLVEALLYFEGFARFLAVTSLAVMLILLFSTTFLYNHCMSGARHISITKKRRIWNLALLLSIFAPFYSALYLLYLLGYGFVFGPVFFMTSYFLPILVFALLNRTWWWNRKFPNVIVNSGLGLKQDQNGLSEIVRTNAVPSEVEDAIRKYISGRIDENELAEISAGHTYSEKLVRAAVSSREYMRKRYRW